MRTTTSTARPARGRLLASVVAIAALAAGLVATATPAVAATAVHVGTVAAGSTLWPGDSVTSNNGQFQLVMQGDGNLVEYGIGRKVLWASNTSGKAGAFTQVRANGTLAIVHNNVRIALWGGAGNVGRNFGVRPDGTMRMINTANKSVVEFPNYQDSVAAGNVILPGTVLRSDRTGSRTLTMRGDGVLAQVVDGKQVWATKTAGNAGAYASVQSDGNFAVYSAAKKWLWSSATSKAGGGKLMVQVDGNVVLYGKADTRAWSTRPVTGLLWPVASTKITGRYGDDRGAGHVPRYHQGTDSPAAVGTPVYASGTGTVTTTVSNNASYGNYVVVTYGNTTVLTAHLSKIGVKQGQIVTKGNEVGKSGNTGQSTGPHVHVEVRQGGTLVDPLGVLHFR
ncbi:D-mannose binding lectin [Curtobacterium sp. PhB172]|uniref:peptidoglycan DD-metalloendopeptidase family protein n=1 Tax=Curtobacterium TaxID=2034 RepID=UPI000F4BA06E|nr:MULTISPECIES: peptidoglycan DD-metalloendopeptidase family protein [Curtobacterium]MBT1623045.1 peptidoglycan DD-metalloendopeptidase family protein [Curtobacterium flaccumfaciens pv. oortii]ROS70232.1 D-mannose binding lectin [Curtobacterium sp. PhB172]